MIADHITADQQPMGLDQAKRLPSSTSMDTTQTQPYQQLQTIHGRAFDRACMGGQRGAPNT